MKIVYRASDIVDAHIVAGMLRANDIDAHVGGHYLQGGVGDLSPLDFATVLVDDDELLPARAIIDEYEQREGEGLEDSDALGLPGRA